MRKFNVCTCVCIDAFKRVKHIYFLPILSQFLFAFVGNRDLLSFNSLSNSSIKFKLFKLKSPFLMFIETISNLLSDNPCKHKNSLKKVNLDVFQSQVIYHFSIVELFVIKYDKRVCL